MLSQKVSEGFFKESVQAYAFLCGEDPNGSQKVAVDSGVHIGLFLGALSHSVTLLTHKTIVDKLQSTKNA